MRDLLPEETRSRRAVARRVLDRFALYGYALVTPPVFEFAEVLERGLGTLDPAEVLRFVEPESGEVAALRPDMTPQIARMIATRLHDRPPPYRLCYEGTVMRRRSRRARKHRQIPQVGIELAGVAGPTGDLELLAVAADALRAAGLGSFTIDLGDAGIVRALLNGAPESVVASVTDALAKKDEAELRERASEAGLEHASALCELVRLHGGRDAITEGWRLLARTPAAPAAARLLELFDAACAQGLAPHLTADLAEVRGFAYYTGTIFHIYAPGPGEAIGAGGRYDELLARFGAPMPSVGFALDLDSVSWALRAASVPLSEEARVIIVGTDDDPRLARLRREGVAAIAIGSAESALAYARSWGFAFVVDGERVIDAVSGEISTQSPIARFLKGA
jgi:ATP phosphoribosyltransferase regulatory subunit